MKIALQALLPLILLASVLFSPAHAEKSKIKVGMILSMTGDLAYFGESMRSTTLFALDRIRQMETKFDYEVIFEDCQYSGTKAALATNKLINSDKVDVLITVFQMFGEVAKPITTKHQIPHITLGISEDLADGAYNFVNYTLDSELARAMVGALEKRNLKKVVLITQTDNYANRLTQAFRKAAKNSSIQILGDAQHGPQERDFRTLLSKMKALNPDIFLIHNFTPCLELIRRQMLEMGITRISGMEIADNTDQPRIFEGVWYVGLLEPSEPFLKEFRKKYTSPIFIGAPNCYDSIQLIRLAYETARNDQAKPTPIEFRDSLRKIKNYPGEIGTLNVLPNGVIESKAFEKMIKDGKAVMLNQ